MDKETLSNYGWIVICVLVLAVMLALSSPFGTFVATGVKSTTQGLFDTNQKALNTTGLMNIEDQDFGDIPSGGIYTKADGTVLKGDNGDRFPDAPATGDEYEYGDYIYKYNYYYSGVEMRWWYSYANQNGWGVRVKDESKSSYGKILSKIAGKPITNMYSTFYGCASLVVAPIIPDSVTDIRGLFRYCTSLTTAPTIPNSVTNMMCTFDGCTSLTTAPIIPNSVKDISYTFWNCKSLTTAPTIPNSVIDMSNTFNGCIKLTTAPAIPSSVNNIRGMFYNCTSLATAPTIPNGTTDMQDMFRGCASLTTAPEIPESVTNMNNTFNGCTKLTTAPTIPNSVEYMNYTFKDCTKLTGEITINTSKLTSSNNYSGCFYLFATGKNITLTGTSSQLQSIANTSTSGKRIVYDINGNILKQ